MGCLSTWKNVCEMSTKINHEDFVQIADVHKARKRREDLEAMFNLFDEPKRPPKPEDLPDELHFKHIDGTYEYELDTKKAGIATAAETKYLFDGLNFTFMGNIMKEKTGITIDAFKCSDPDCGVCNLRFSKEALEELEKKFTSTPLRSRKDLIKDAFREKGQLETMKALAKLDNDCEAVLIIDGVKHAFSTSQVFIECIDNEIKEIKKAIAGKKNNWE